MMMMIMWDSDGLTMSCLWHHVSLLLLLCWLNQQDQTKYLLLQHIHSQYFFSNSELWEQRWDCVREYLVIITPADAYSPSHCPFLQCAAAHTWTTIAGVCGDAHTVISPYTYCTCMVEMGPIVFYCLETLIQCFSVIFIPSVKCSHVTVSDFIYISFNNPFVASVSFYICTNMTWQVVLLCAIRA